MVQWPGSYCDTKKSCCYPKSGKPAADFGIHGLWPNRDDGTYPQDCNPDNAFDPSKVLIFSFLISRMHPWPAWPWCVRFLFVPSCFCPLFGKKKKAIC